MTVDLEELKRLAKAATPGPWQVSLNGSGEDGWVEDSNSQYLTTGYEGEMAAKDVRFIAAANPAAVLALIERVEEAERHAAFLTDWSQATTEVVCGERPKGVMVATTLEAVRALKARVAALEALARKGLEAYHLGASCANGHDVKPGESTECEHQECREWAAALEAK